MSNILDIIRSKYVDDTDLLPIDPYPISVCTALYNSEPFLDRFIKCLLSLDYPCDLMRLYFTVQGKDNTYEKMHDFKLQFQNRYRDIRVEEVDQYRGGNLPHIQNVVKCRNILSKWSQPDPVFFIDHDNFPPPITIKRLQQNLFLGASMTAGVYLFYKRYKKNLNQEGAINFTSFFFINGELGAIGLNNQGMEGIFPLEIFSKRLWADAIAMGSTLVSRELLDEYDFIVPDGNLMSDDTAYCLQAGKSDHKFIADFGLIIPHWGYRIQTNRIADPDLIHIKVDIEDEMTQRRKKMHEDGVYIR